MKKLYLLFTAIKALKQFSLTSALRVAGLVLFSVLLAACAQIPENTVQESQFVTLNCTELAQQTEEAKKTKEVAERAKSDSWHVIMPVIVAARYSQAASASTEADRRMGLLAQQHSQRGCTL